MLVEAVSTWFRVRVEINTWSCLVNVSTGTFVMNAENICDFGCSQNVRMQGVTPMQLQSWTVDSSQQINI